MYLFRYLQTPRRSISLNEALDKGKLTFFGPSPTRTIFPPLAVASIADTMQNSIPVHSRVTSGWPSNFFITSSATLSGVDSLVTRMVSSAPILFAISKFSLFISLI